MSFMRPYYRVVGDPDRPGRIRVPASLEPLARRQVYFTGKGWTDTAVHRFEALTEADRIVGPAVVESDFTSVVIDPGTTARRDAMGTLVIDLGSQE